MLQRASYVVVLVTLAVTEPLVAQTGTVWVEARGGWLVPTNDLGRTDVIANSGFGVFERVDGSPVLGVGVGLGLGTRWALRASYDHALDADVRGEWKCAPFVACPSVLLPLDGVMSRQTAMIDAMYRPAAELPLTPVLFAGLGVRKSRLTWSEPAADITLPAFSFDETDPVVRFGLGLERTLGATSLFGEVAMTTTRFGGASFESIEGSLPADRDLSLDLGLFAGVRITLR